MWCSASNKSEEIQRNSGLCRAGTALVEALNAGGCESKQLASLLEVLVDHLDQVRERIDPLRAAELAADVTRIAQDWSARMSGRLFEAEERSCSAAAHAAPPGCL